MAATINLKVKSDFDQASADLKKFNKNLSETERAKVQKYFDTYKDKSINKFLERQKKATIAIKATRGPLEAAQSEFRALQREMERLIKKGIDPQDKALKPLIARYKKLEKEVKDANAAQKKQGSRVKDAIKGFLGMSAAIAAARKGMQLLIKAGTDFRDYSKTLANVNTLLDITNAEMATLDFELGKVSSEFAIQKQELSAGIYQAVSAGAQDLSQALDIVTASAQLAKGGLIENAQAVDIVTTAMNAYGSEVVDATKATDIFFNIVKEGKINGEELSQTIGNSITIFASAKISIEELGAGISAMTKVGVKAANATTQLNAIVTSFLKPSEDMKAALKAQNIESGAALLEVEGLAGALKFLTEQTGGNLDEMAKLVPNIRGLKGVLALASNEGAVFNDILEEFEDVSGRATEAAAKQTDGFAKAAFEIEQAKINTENFSITIGQALLPVAASMAKVLGDMAKGAADYVGGLNDLQILLDDFDDGIIDSTFSLEQLQNVMASLDIRLQQRGSADTKKDLMEMQTLVQALIDSFGVEDQFLKKLTVDEVERRRVEEESLRAAIKREEERNRLNAENLAAEKELEKLRIAALSTEEKRIAVINNEVERLVILRTAAREFGTDFSAIQSLINKLIAERNDLQKEEIEIETKTISLQTQAAINRQAHLDAENQALDDLINNLNERFEVVEKTRTAIVAEGEDFLSMALAERDHLIWIDELEQRNAEAKQARLDAEMAEAEAAHQRKIDMAMEIASLTTGIFTALDALSSANAAAELQRLEEAGASEEELAQRKKEIAREEAIRKKKLGLFNVGIDTSAAIMGFLANPGGFAGVGLSIAAGVKGGIEAAAISAQPIPTAQTGTGTPITIPETNRRGDNIGVIAGAGETVSVSPRGESGQMIHITTEIDKQVIFDIVTEGNESGEIRITADNIQGGVAV